MRIPASLCGTGAEWNAESFIKVQSGCSSRAFRKGYACFDRGWTQFDTMRFLTTFLRTLQIISAQSFSHLNRMLEFGIGCFFQLPEELAILSVTEDVARNRNQLLPIMPVPDGIFGFA